MLGGKLGGATAEFASGFCFGLHISVTNIFLRFGFAHIDGVSRFYDKVHFIFVCAIRPVYVKLTRYWPNPFENFIIGFKYEREVKLG